MFFAEGTHVNKGQTLFVIDPKLYGARANRARVEEFEPEEHHAPGAESRARPERRALFSKRARQVDLDNAVRRFTKALRRTL